MADTVRVERDFASKRLPSTSGKVGRMFAWSGSRVIKTPSSRPNSRVQTASRRRGIPSETSEWFIDRGTSGKGT